VIRAIAVVPFVVPLLLAQAQPPQLQPDPQNPVAAPLLGAWRQDPELGKRLGRAKAPREVTFRSDASVLERLPAAAAQQVAGRRVYAAGTVTVGARDDLWLLTEIAGAATVVVSRDRGAGAAGDVETLTVAVARGATAAADLLLLNGDPGKQPCAAYARVEAPAATDPAAALAAMATLVETGKHVEFLRDWLLPADLARMQKGGRTLQACAAEFAEAKAKGVLEALRAAAKLTPRLDDATGEAVYSGDGLERPLRLQRVGDRWYVCNR
jgi:hypothetical protein